MNNLYWVSIIPPLVTIGLAIYSKKIIPSLLFGLLIGGFLISGTFIGGIEAVIEYIIKILSDRDNLEVLLFLYLFSGLVLLIKRSGGIKAFSNIANGFIKTKRGVLYVLWGLVPLTFIDCGFRVIATGSITGELARKNKIPKEQHAFMLNNTASPIVELIPIATTFVGYNISIIHQGLTAAGVGNQSAYSVWLRAIPLEFFSIIVILITFLSIYTKPKKKAKAMEMKADRKSSHEGMGMMNMKMAIGDEVPLIKPRIINLVLPLVSVLTLSIYFFWYFGKEKVIGRAGISEIISSTDPNKAMLVALFITLVISSTVYFVQKYPIKKITSDIISGGNQIMKTIAILALAWPLALISQDLGLSTFIQQGIGTAIPTWSIPVTMFIVSSAVTYFIGSGWGATSLIMPFAILLAVSSHIYIPLTVAAVITGATFGDITSPIAGMTNMASYASGADHAKYLRYATPYNLTAAGISAALFLVFGFIL